MEDLLIKMNMVRKHNEIIRLKKQIEKKENENNLLIKEYKNTFDTFDQKISNINEELCQKIELLEKENTRLISNVKVLELENKGYREQIYNIPKIILKIFSKRKKLLKGDKQ